MFAFAISGFDANFFSRNAIVPSVGRVNSHDISPSANMFFERSASRLVDLELLQRLDRQRGQRHRVHLVSSSEPSSSGLTV